MRTGQPFLKAGHGNWESIELPERRAWADKMISEHFLSLLRLDSEHGEMAFGSEDSEVGYQDSRKLLRSQEELSLIKLYVSHGFGMFSGSGTNMFRLICALVFKMYSGETLEAKSVGVVPLELEYQFHFYLIYLHFGLCI